MRHVSVDDELDAQPELGMELLRIATPQATLPEIGEQGDTVSHVKLHIERQRTAVDEGTGWKSTFFLHSFKICGSDAHLIGLAAEGAGHDLAAG